MSDGEYEKAKPELMRRVFGSKKPNHEEFDALRNLCRLKSMLDEACLRRLEQMELTDPEAAATPGAPTAH